jgi:hypothetical protein
MTANALLQSNETQAAAQLLRDVSAYFWRRSWVRDHYHHDDGDCLLGAMRRVGMVVNFLDATERHATNWRRNMAYSIAVNALSERLRQTVATFVMIDHYPATLGGVDTLKFVPKLGAEHIIVRWNDCIARDVAEVRELLLSVADDLDIFAGAVALRASMAVAANATETTVSRVGRNPVAV